MHDYKVVFSSAVFRNTAWKSQEKQSIVIFKLGLMYPLGLMQESLINPISTQINSRINIQAIVQVIIVAMLIPVVYYMFLRTSIFFSESLDKLNTIFKGILDGKKLAANDEEFLDNPREVRETFSCFQTIKSTFD